MGHEQQIGKMQADAQRALIRIFTQGIVVAVVTLWIGSASLREDSVVIAVLAFMIAGAALYSCLARTVVILLVHRGRVWSLGLNEFYRQSVESLYKAYGHDAAQALKEMPKPPTELEMPQ